MHYFVLVNTHVCSFVVLYCTALGFILCMKLWFLVAFA